jgi:hypothetical protein
VTDKRGGETGTKIGPRQDWQAGKYWVEGEIESFFKDTYDEDEMGIFAELLGSKGYISSRNLKNDYIPVICFTFSMC